MSGLALAAPQPRRDAAASWLLMAGGFASLALSLNGGDRAAVLAPIAAAGLFLGAFALRRPVIPWRHVLVALIVVILFIPIRRYRLPVDLSFEVEPYRVLVALILAGWGAALLVDRRVTLRRSGFEGPLALIVLVALASILVNPGRVSALEATVVKAFSFLLGFILVLYLIVSVVRTQATADLLAKTLVGGGAILALLAVVESRTGFSPFTELDRVIPFLVPYPGGGTEDALVRGGTTRAFASAEHPIALGAALMMLVPLAIHVVRVSNRRIWYAALLALVIGSLTTVSRTGIIMLVVIGIVYLWLRPRETRRLWPLLIPLLVATHFVAPGTLGSLKQSFFPEGGLIEQQRSSEGDCASAGRVADLAPTLAEASERPFLGQGYGTRVPSGPAANACILDNQWLGSLLELGLAGLIAWLWLFRSVVRKLGRPAKGDDSPAASLMIAATAAVTAYGVGMLTFDAFSFIQVTFLLFIILGLAAAVAADYRRRPAPRSRRAAKRRAPVITRPVADAA